MLTHGVSITPAIPFIKLSSITVMFSILGKDLFLFPLWTLGKLIKGGGQPLKPFYANLNTLPFYVLPFTGVF